MKTIIYIYMFLLILSCERKPVTLVKMEYICNSIQNDTFYVYFKFKNNTNETYNLKYKEICQLIGKKDTDISLNKMYIYSPTKDSVIIDSLISRSFFMHSFPDLKESNNFFLVSVNPSESVFLRFNLENLDDLIKVNEKIKKVNFCASITYIENYDSLKKGYRFGVIKSNEFELPINVKR